jgi:hypothetical protein
MLFGLIPGASRETGLPLAIVFRAPLLRRRFDSTLHLRSGDSRSITSKAGWAEQGFSR